MLTDCLAATGPASALPIVIIASVLLVAGVVAIVIARRRSGWAALALVPLLAGAALLGAPAPAAQAATACDCAPAAVLDDLSVLPDPWAYSNIDGFDGWIGDWDAADGPAVAQLLNAATPSATASAFISVSYFNGIDTTYVSFQVDDLPVVQQAATAGDILVSPVDPFFTYISRAIVEDGFAAAYPDVEADIELTGVILTIFIPQPDGCGGVATSTLMFEAPAEENAG